MRFLFCIAFVFGCVASLPAQESILHVVNTKFKTVVQLHQHLSKGELTDEEKVKAYFNWITKNIKYDELAIMGISHRKTQSDEEVLQRHRAICSEYSNLFKTLCSFDSIEVYVVSGYVRKRPFQKIKLGGPDHAWNIINLSGKWYQIDLTWAAGIQQEPEKHPGRSAMDYYFPEPAKFIQTHLPSLPFWQLLECPVPAEVFEHSRDSMISWLEKKEKCYSFKDSISTFISYSPKTRKLLEAMTCFEFLPSEENKKQVAQEYIDLHSSLFERSEELQFSDSLNALVAVQYEMYTLCQKARSFSDLYINQVENCAYTQFNLAVSLFRFLNENESDFSPTERLKRYQEILFHFQSSKAELENLPKNFLVENAISQLNDYIPFIKESIIYQKQRR